MQKTQQSGKGKQGDHEIGIRKWRVANCHFYGPETKDREGEPVPRSVSTKKGLGRTRSTFCQKSNGWGLVMRLPLKSHSWKLYPTVFSI
jgi:hypothetical protein